MDAVYSRWVHLFSDVVCIFADDFPTLDSVYDHLQSWVYPGSASTLPLDVWPRLLIVVSEDGPHNDLVEDFGKSIESSLGSQITLIFSALKIFRLAGGHLSSLVRYQRFKYQIRGQLEEMRAIRRHLRCLFSGSHLAAFCQSAIDHTIATKSGKFDFITSARLAIPIPDNLHQFLEVFSGIATRAKVPYGVTASFIASSIMMDAYPPQMHCMLY